MPAQTHEEVDALYNLSQVLQCGLDRRVVSVLLELLEAGVHPESLADIVNLVGVKDNPK